MVAKRDYGGFESTFSQLSVLLPEVKLEIEYFDRVLIKAQLSVGPASNRYHAALGL